jgi:hypothetical protein
MSKPSQTNWISVKTEKPSTSSTSAAIVLVWPREAGSRGVVYYGPRICSLHRDRIIKAARVSDKPVFYLYGSEVKGVTHWQPLPDGPIGGKK